MATLTKCVQHGLDINMETSKPQGQKSLPSLQPAKTFPKVRTLQGQLKMVKDWETQPGQQTWGSASIILEDAGDPMTQERFLNVEGLGGLILEEVLDNLEVMVAEGILPPWFGQLPSSEEDE